MTSRTTGWRRKAWESSSSPGWMRWKSHLVTFHHGPFVLTLGLSFIVASFLWLVWILRESLLLPANHPAVVADCAKKMRLQSINREKKLGSVQLLNKSTHQAYKKRTRWINRFGIIEKHIVLTSVKLWLRPVNPKCKWVKRHRIWAKNHQVGFKPNPWTKEQKPHVRWIWRNQSASSNKDTLKLHSMSPQHERCRQEMAVASTDRKCITSSSRYC